MARVSVVSSDSFHFVKPSNFECLRQVCNQCWRSIPLQSESQLRCWANRLWFYVMHVVSQEIVSQYPMRKMFLTTLWIAKKVLQSFDLMTMMKLNVTWLLTFQFETHEQEKDGQEEENVVMAAVPETMISLISLQYGSQISQISYLRYLRLGDIASLVTLVRLGIVFEGPWIWRLTEPGVNGKVKRGMSKKRV